MSFHIFTFISHFCSNCEKTSPEKRRRISEEFEKSKQPDIKITVEPTLSGHPRDQKKCPFKRGVRLWEVKNVVFVCS